MGIPSGEVSVDPTVPLSLEVTAPPGGSVKLGDHTTKLTYKVTEDNSSNTHKGKIKPSALESKDLDVVAPGVSVPVRESKDTQQVRFTNHPQRQRSFGRISRLPGALGPRIRTHLENLRGTQNELRDNQAPPFLATPQETRKE